MPLPSHPLAIFLLSVTTWFSHSFFFTIQIVLEKEHLYVSTLVLLWLLEFNSYYYHYYCASLVRNWSPFLWLPMCLHSLCVHVNVCVCVCVCNSHYSTEDKDNCSRILLSWKRAPFTHCNNSLEQEWGSKYKNNSRARERKEENEIHIRIGSLGQCQ